MVIIHLLYLHQTGSHNMLGLNTKRDQLPFHPYYSLKDFLGAIMAFVLLVFFARFIPNVLGDSENFIYANALVTPTHIAPEWYFLWVYCILRSIPSKLGGVVAIFSGLLLLLVLPFRVDSRSLGVKFDRLGEIIMVWFACWFCALTYLGGCHVEWPFENLGQIFTSLYFVFYLSSPL